VIYWINELAQRSTNVCVFTILWRVPALSLAKLRAAEKFSSLKQESRAESHKFLIYALSSASTFIFSGHRSEKSNLSSSKQAHKASEDL
jgi:hypothetical protein